MHRAWPCCFYSKTGFWHSYCQISTDLDKILHTPVVVRNKLVSRLRPRSARGRLQAKPKQLCFCNTCNAPQVLYRDDESPRFRRQTVRVKVRMGAIVKIFLNFVAWAFFAFLGYPLTILRTAYRKQFYPKPMVPWKAETLTVCLFASLKSL